MSLQNATEMTTLLLLIVSILAVLKPQFSWREWSEKYKGRVVTEGISELS